jgi:hypothetical protein
MTNLSPAKLFMGIIFIGSFLFFSCENPSLPKEFIVSIEKKAIARPELSGTAYHFFGPIDTTTCSLGNVVDGGDWDLVFINDSSFIKIHYFMNDKSVDKGIYYWEKEKILLRFDSILVERITDFKCGKSKGNIAILSSFSTNKIYIQPGRDVKLTVKKCSDGNFYLSWLDKNSFEREEDGIKIDSATPEKYIRQLKNDSIWKLLYSKN